MRRWSGRDVSGCLNGLPASVLHTTTILDGPWEDSTYGPLSPVGAGRSMPDPKSTTRASSTDTYRGLLRMRYVLDRTTSQALVYRKSTKQDVSFWLESCSLMIYLSAFLTWFMRFVRSGYLCDERGMNKFYFIVNVNM